MSQQYLEMYHKVSPYYEKANNIKINEGALLLGFWKFKEQYYSNGASCELDDFRRAVKIYLAVIGTNNSARKKE